MRRQGKKEKGNRIYGRKSDFDKMRRRLMKVGIWMVPAIAETLILTHRSFGQTPCEPDQVPGGEDLPAPPIFRKLKRRKEEEEKRRRRRLRILEDEDEGNEKSGSESLLDMESKKSGRRRIPEK